LFCIADVLAIFEVGVEFGILREGNRHGLQERSFSET